MADIAGMAFVQIGGKAELVADAGRNLFCDELFEGVTFVSESFSELHLHHHLEH